MLCKLCPSHWTVYAVLLCQIKLQVKDALVVFEYRGKSSCPLDAECWLRSQIKGLLFCFALWNHGRLILLLQVCICRMWLCFLKTRTVPHRFSLPNRAWPLVQYMLSEWIDLMSGKNMVEDTFTKIHLLSINRFINIIIVKSVSKKAAALWDLV